MGTRYSSRSLGLVSLQRFLAVERYWECRRPVVPAQPSRAPRPGDPTAKRAAPDRTSGTVR